MAKDSFFLHFSIQIEQLMSFFSLSYGASSLMQASLQKVRLIEQQEGSHRY